MNRTASRGAEPSSNLKPNKVVEALLAVATAAVVLDLSLQPVLGLDTDLWWHLAGGRWMAEHGGLALADPFSHTAYGAWWNNRHWLFQDLLYALYAVGGDNAVVLLRTFLIVAAAFCLDRAARLRGAGPLARAIAVCWAIYLASRYFHIRPNFVSLFLGALCLWILELALLRRARAAWSLPIIFVIWSNSHGGVPMAMLYACGAYAAHDVWRSRRDGVPPALPWGWLLAACALATFITPNPLAGTWYVFDLTLTHNPYVSMMSEFTPPDLLSWANAPSVALMAACAVGGLLALREGRLVDLLLCIGFFPVVARAGRNLFLLLPWLAPTLAYTLQRIPPPRAGRLLTALGCALLMLLTVRELVDAGRRALPPDRLIRWESVPEDAARYMLAHHLEGRMFNDITWGGYLIWRVPNPVFIDARNDLVYRDAALLDDYAAILEGHDDALARLDRRGVDIVVQRHGYDEGPLFDRLLASSKQWQRPYDDGITALWVRVGTKSTDGTPAPDWLDPYRAALPLLQQGQLGAAVDLLRASLALYPDSTRTRLQLGVALAQAGQLDEAIRQWRLALLINDRLYTAHLNLGIAAQLQGHPWDAACEFLEELRLDDDPKARARLDALPAWPPPTHLREIWLAFWAPLVVW